MKIITTSKFILATIMLIACTCSSYAFAHSIFNDRLINLINDEDYQEADRLISSGYQVNIHDIFGITPLLRAVYKGNKDVVNALLEAEANPNDADDGGATPMHFAAKYGRTEIAQILIKNGAQIDTQDANGWTPLMRASSNKHPKIVKLLIDNGANVSLESVENKTAIEYAAQFGNIEAFETLYTIDDATTKEQQDRIVSAARNSYYSADLMNVIEKYSDQNDQEHNHSKTENNAHSKHKRKNKKHQKESQDKQKECYSLVMGEFESKRHLKKYQQKTFKHPLLHSFQTDTTTHAHSQTVELGIKCFSKNSITNLEEMVGILHKEGIDSSIKLSTVKKNRHPQFYDEKLASVIEKFKKKQVTNKEKEAEAEAMTAHHRHPHQQTEETALPTEYWVFDFGLFATTKHAHQYWKELKRAKWMGVFSPKLTKIMDHERGIPFIQMKTGTIYDTQLAHDIYKILNTMGARVSLEQDRHALEKYEAISKEQFISYLNNENDGKNHRGSHSKGRSGKRIEVKEAIIVDKQQYQLTKQKAIIKVGHYRNKHKAAMSIVAAKKQLPIKKWSMANVDGNRLNIYVELQDNNTAKACEHFVNQGYDCNLAIASTR